MYLIRGGARIMWISTRFIKLNDICKSHILKEISPVNQASVLQLHVQTNSNSPYESSPQSNKLQTLETNSEQYPQGSLNPATTSSSMGYAEVKKMVDKKLNSRLEDESFALLLLEACRDMLPDAGLEARQELVQEAWDVLEKLGQTFTLEHYKVLLSIYAKNSQYINAEEFLNAMKATPDKDTYRLLLDAVAEIGDYTQILSMIAKFKDMGYPINETTFNSLILAYSINTDVDGARAVVDTMQAARIELNSASYCALSRGFAAMGDLVNLERTLRIGNLNTKQFMSVIKSLSTSGHGKHISEVMSHSPNAMDIKSKDCVCTIVELTHLGKARDAFEIVNALPVQNTLTDSSVGFADFFLQELVKSDTPMEEVQEICQNLISSKKNLTALLKVTEAALRLKKEETALLAFEAMRNNGYEIRPHFYWPLLINAAFNKQETDVMRLVKHMVDNKVRLDDETLSHYTIPYLSVEDPFIVVRRFQDSGVKISQLLTPLLAALLRTGKLKQAITLMDQIRGKVKKDVIIKHLLQGYLITKNLDDTAQLLSNINSSSHNGKFLMDLIANERVAVTNEELVSAIFAFNEKKLKICGISAVTLEPRIMLITKPEGLLETFKRLIETEPNAKDAAIHAWIPHPRDMTVEQLEDHLTDLSIKGMNTRGVLRKLVQAHCNENNLKKAEKFGGVFINKGFKWTTGMTCGMFSLYTAHNMLDEADIFYKELREKHNRFKIDEHKILDYATVLVKNNKLERALEVLTEQENVRNAKENLRNCSRLLNAVAAASDPNNTKRILNLLIEKGYCAISNHVLAPLIRAHLSNNDLPAAITEFKAYANIHRKVPLRQELLRAIVQTCTDKSEAEKKLTEVLAAIKRIHGKSAADSHQIMALAATNKEKELHTFMKMLDVNQSTLSTSAQRLTDEKDLSALQTMLKACRGITKIEKGIIYESILTLCSRTGDCKTALQIWENIQSEDVDPSAMFIKKLKALLESQRIPLPSELVFHKTKKKVTLFRNRKK